MDPSQYVEPKPHADMFRKQFLNYARGSYKRKGPLAQARREIERARAAGRTDAADTATMICLQAQTILDDPAATVDAVRLVHPLVVGAFEALGLAKPGTGRRMAARQGTVEATEEDIDDDIPARSSAEMQFRRTGELFLSPRETSVRETDARWTTAWHEAGHAMVLVARRRAAALRWVCVHETAQDGELGHCCYDGESVPLDVQRDVYLGGLVSTFARSYSARGASSDLRRLQELGFLSKHLDVSVTDDPMYVLRECSQLAALRAEVEWMLKPYFSFQSAVADALFVRGCLTGQEIRDAASRFRPGTTPNARELFGI